MNGIAYYLAHHVDPPLFSGWQIFGVFITAILVGVIIRRMA